MGGVGARGMGLLTASSMRHAAVIANKPATRERTARGKGRIPLATRAESVGTGGISVRIETRVTNAGCRATGSMSVTTPVQRVSYVRI